MNNDIPKEPKDCIRCYQDGEVACEAREAEATPEINQSGEPRKRVI